MALESYLLVGDKSRAFALAKEVASQFSATNCSTQEVAFVSAAMSRMSYVIDKSTSEVAISDDSGERSVISNLRGVKSLSLDTAHKYVEVINRGNEELYTALMTRRTPSADEQIMPEANGVEIAVRYTDLEGRTINIESINQGAEFLAHIDVRKLSNSSESLALCYAVASGWEIWNERLVGGANNLGTTYTDIRDERISWYFSLGANESRCFTVRLRAAYAGTFILPPTVCEDMYNTSCRATTSNSKTIVK